MANNTSNVHLFAEKRLNIAREAELLQSYVRANTDDDDSHEDEKTSKVEHKEVKKEDSVENDPNKNKQSSQDENGNVTENLTTEIKKKGRRRRRKNHPRHEELYCDKDRAAAVNLGSKDIKQSLKLKRKQDRSQMLQIPEEAEPATFLALGNYEMGRGDVKIALDFMSKALELNPGEKNALVARSKCYILMGQPENALKDAETALKMDKHFLKAIYQKAESLYYLGDFEHSLMYYHRGLHIRPDHEGFKLGVHKAQKAIENALGSAFADILGGSRQKSANDAVSSSRSSKTTSRNSSSISNRQSQRTTPISKTKSARKSRLLRELGADKEYLDNLMNNPNLKCKYKENDDTIEKCIQETVEFLNKRQEFWRQQLPPNFK